MLLQSIRSFSVSAARQSFAKVQLLGTVGSVYFRETKDGVKFINYSLAVNRYNGQEEEQTADWFSISVFNERAIQTFEKILKPGMQLFVEADVKQRQVQDEQSGQNYNLWSLKQNSFDVVRFAKNKEEQVE